MSIYTAPIYKLGKLKNLFIEMTSKNCNQRCSSCFIDFPLSKAVKDFIPFDLVKKTLYEINKKELNCIYLSGAEPMTHPEFNSILRLCLKFCNVCICTNGSFLNEKKIRFLKKVEDEGGNQIFFKLTLTHFGEIENDKSRYRGNFRQVIHALKILCKYNFTSVLSIQNFYNLDKNTIYENFKNIFKLQEITNTDIQIIPSYPCRIEESIESNCHPDCTNGRVLTEKGIYSCPFLADDYRGRCGSSIKDFSDTICAETDFCYVCSKCNKEIFAIG